MRLLAQVILNVGGKTPSVKSHAHQELQMPIVVLILHASCSLIRNVRLIHVKIFQLIQIVGMMSNAYGQQQIKLNVRMILAHSTQVDQNAGLNQNVNGLERNARLILVIQMLMRLHVD